MSTSQAEVSWPERLALSRCYWGSGRGQALVVAQKACLGPVLKSRRDKHGLELSMGASLLAKTSLAGPSHVMQWAPTRQCAERDATLICSPEALALPDECIDVTLIHHFLEYCSSAPRVLAEAARVTSDSGVLVIFGFHPLGVASLEYRLGHKRQAYPGNGAWNTPGKLRAWLEFVDFEVERVDYCGFRAYGGKACRERWETLGRRYNLPWGASYMIRARRKRRCAPIQRLKFSLEAPITSRSFATRLQSATPDKTTPDNTSRRKKR